MAIAMESITPASNKKTAMKKAAAKHSPYHIYLNSLASSGRNPMATLLNQCTQLLEHKGSPESYEWHKLSFEKVSLIRASLVDLGYSVNTINMCLAGLRGVIKAAFNLGQTNADNMMRINSVKTLKGNAVRTGRRLSKKEVKQLLNTCNALPNTSRVTREKALLLIGIGAGLRCTEICSLKLEDFETTQGLLKVIEGKGRKHRQIYLAESVVKALNHWIKQRGPAPGALFTGLLKSGTPTNQPLTPSGLTYALRVVQVQAGVEGFTPHDMRRTFITQLLEKGVDLNTVRLLAGHSDVSTTVRYDKRDEVWQKNASRGIRF